MSKQLNACDRLSSTMKVKSGIYNVSPEDNVFIYYDKTKNLSYQEASKLLKDDQFLPYSQESVPNLFSRGLYNNWIYFCIANIDSIPINLLLRGNIYLDSIFISDGGNLIKSDFIDKRRSKDKENVLTVRFSNAYFLNIARGQSLEILIKNYNYAYGLGSIIPKISDTKVYEAKYYAEHNDKIFLYTSGVFVIVTIILIFGFQWIFSRDKLYFWYCFYALSCLFVLWRNLEDIQPMFYSTQYYITWNDSKVFHSIAVFFTYMVFCSVFLEFNPPFLKKMVKLLTWFCIVAVISEIILISIEYDHYFRWLFYKFVRFFLTVLGIISIFLSFKSTHPLAKYIIVGSSLMALAEVVSMVLPVRLSSTISLMSVYGDFVIFSIALGIRSKLIENEKMKLTMENLKLQADKEIAASQLKSRIANDIHDEIGLGLTSANYLLYNMLSINTKDEFDKDVKRVIGLNSTMVTQMHDIIWSMDESKDNIMEFCADLKAIFKEFQQNHQLKGKFSNSNMFTDIKINGFIRRNLLMCLKECLNNAVKHGKPTSIEVNLDWTEEKIILHIKDNGVGFSEMKTENPMMGNGMKNIQKRVKDCRGIVKLYNADGANIFIEIPILLP